MSEDEEKQPKPVASDTPPPDSLISDSSFGDSTEPPSEKMLNSSIDINKKLRDCFGYHFTNEDKLRTSVRSSKLTFFVQDNEPFKFTTQKAYEALGELIGEYIFQRLVELGLKRIYVSYLRAASQETLAA